MATATMADAAALRCWVKGSLQPSL